ncbi:MAG TPA: ABC transporter permease [Gammaproteobacteria bacterium]|nr:ABC transporter permease [Gammaproteobacteria bacterium]
MSILGFADSVGRDLRYALRGLARRPAFTFAAVLTLALGIGATTAIFSVVYSVLIKPLPYPDADQLVRIRHPAPGIDFDDLSADPTMYLTYRAENRTFASIGLWDEGWATLTERGEPTRVRTLRVTDGTLQALGVQPMVGRWFTEREYGPASDGPEPVILSYAFWQRRFGGDEAVLGRELAMETPSGVFAQPLAGPRRVVGIMPRGFRFLDMTPQPDVIVAVRLDPAQKPVGNFSFEMLARLAPGVTAAEARADLERMLPIWLDSWPVMPQDLANFRITPIALPLKDDLVGSVPSTLGVLMGAIGAVLLIACANIATLMLVRADARRQEFAVRTALGAGRARIARALLVESLCLGAAGGVLGWLLAYIGVEALVAIGPNNLPRLEEIAVYPPVLAFTVAISLASTLVFGSITTLKHAMLIDTPMSGAPRGASASRARSTTRSALVAVQVALALMLVVSAALMVRTFEALRDVDPGFSAPATIQTVHVWIPSGLLSDRAEQYLRLQREILGKIAALPGVASVGFANGVPMDGRTWPNATLSVEAETSAPDKAAPLRRFVFVSPGYFKAMGTRMIAGRDLNWNDIETGRHVIVISENLAREIAGTPEAALGRRIRRPFEDAPWSEVIGVAQSVHQDGLYDEPPRTVYWPVSVPNWQRQDVTFVIRSERAGTASFAAEIRQAIRSVNASLPIAQTRTMREFYADSLARTSFTLVLLVIAGSMALTLGVIGIYGVIAYVVSQRTREIGIRSALGAEPRDLVRAFVLHGLAVSGLGAAIGLLAAMGLARLMSSLLFGVAPTDPAAYAAALTVIIAAAALATYLPARRAASIDPIETLKAE